MTVTGVVLAAGGSRWLGTPKQVLPFRDTTLRRIVVAGSGAIGVCRYADGIGHPFWLSRSVFGDLRQLRGDRGVWRLVQSARRPVREFEVDGPVPLDVDTWDDYRRMLESIAP